MLFRSPFLQQHHHQSSPPPPPQAANNNQAQSRRKRPSTQKVEPLKRTASQSSCGDKEARAESALSGSGSPRANSLRPELRMDEQQQQQEEEEEEEADGRQELEQEHGDELMEQQVVGGMELEAEEEEEEEEEEEDEDDDERRRQLEADAQQTGREQLGNYNSIVSPPSAASSPSSLSECSFGAQRPGGQQAPLGEPPGQLELQLPGGAAALFAQNSAVYELAALTPDLDTPTITTRIKETLMAHNLGQKIFGEVVLGLSQGSVSELLSKPKPWHMLSIKGREPFIRMHLWLNDKSNIDRLQSLKNERREAKRIKR